MSSCDVGLFIQPVEAAWEVRKMATVIWQRRRSTYEFKTRTMIICWVSRDEVWGRSFRFTITMLSRAAFLVSKGNDIISRGSRTISRALLLWSHRPRSQLKPGHQTSVAPYSTDNRSNGFAVDSLYANCSILAVYWYLMPFDCCFFYQNQFYQRS